MTRTTAAPRLPQDSEKTLSSAEVKRLLHEIAFVIRLSRGIQLEIVGGGRRKPAASANDDTVLLAA
jgi:hypothetical protein